MTSNLRIDSNFNVGDIISPIQEPEILTCNAYPALNYSCDYDDENFTIMVNGRIITLSSTDDKLRKIRHEIVSNVMTFDSDMKLNQIGIQGEDGDLTPDYINPMKHTVLEVSTCAISEPFALKDSYQGKLVKYKYLVEPVGYNLAILVVSGSAIMTNMPITQDVVNALCYRARIGLALEGVITDKLGVDIFSEDLSGMESIVLNELRKISDKPQSDTNFDIDIITSCGTPPTKLDYSHVGEVLGTGLREAKQRSTEGPENLVSYLKGFDQNTTMKMKRVCNIPMVYLSSSSNEGGELDPEESGLDPWMMRIWSEARGIETEVLSIKDIIDEAVGSTSFDRHRVQKGLAFNVKLGSNDKLEAAKAGLWAKALDKDPVIMEKSLEDKKSFHPTNTPTDDIKLFTDTTLMSKIKSNAVPSTILRLLKDTKRLWNKSIRKTDPLSLQFFSSIIRTEAAHFGQTISTLMTEICYTYKYWVKRADFYHKKINGVHMIIRSTGSHVFVSYAFPKNGSKIIETGRIGPRLFESNNYIFTEFCSYNEPTIEHFVKAGPYLCSLICHLVSHFEQPLDSVSLLNTDITTTFNHILLLYLNNKTDVEELITAQRYLTMGVLEELDPNPYRFVERLPEVLRSRLTCYFTTKTLDHIRIYNNNKIFKMTVDKITDSSMEYKGILSLFCSGQITLKQKINEFYFGYVVSKERGRGSDRNFKIMKKIVAEEYRFRDKVVNTFQKTLEPGVHVSNPIVIKVFLHMFKDYLKKTLGEDYKSVIRTEILRSLARTTFPELATLKASSRSYNETIIIPDLDDCTTTKMAMDKLVKANPNEAESRPKVLEALVNIVSSYEEDTGLEIDHPIRLLSYCLNKLETTGYFDSDIFPKPQHGGDREIHVLHITARICQYTIECMAKTLCRLIPSDSLTHPSEKDSFMRKHYIRATDHLGSKFVTLGKSADATKWCQRNHCSKFAAILANLVPDEMVPVVLRVLRLWQYKRISFPIQFAANFVHNKDVQSNKIYIRMRDEFLTGSGIFPNARNNKIIVKSGMMQGILHYLSSLVHAVLQVVMMMIVMRYLERKGLKCLVTIIQGSDDSAQVISIPGHVSKAKLRLLTTMLHWKERVGIHFSINNSRAKSSIGTLDLVEYNSEWIQRSTVLKPTFRWVSACMDSSITERFIDRYNQNYGTASQVLEGGGKTLEVAVIQICQAWLHYMLIGLHTSPLAIQVSHLIWELKDPALGLFPLDSDFAAGLTGVDFSIFKIFKDTSYGAGLEYGSLHNTELEEYNQELKDVSIGKSLRSTRIKFGSLKVWNSLVGRMSIPQLKEIMQEVDDNPYLIYKPLPGWKFSKYSVYLKLFEPGVKESLSKFSAAARMMSASAYMISRPCVTVYKDGEAEKMSLFKALVKSSQDRENLKKPPMPQAFVHHIEYQEILSYIEHLEKDSVLVPAEFKTRSKQKILVFEKGLDDIPLIDLCKKYWMGLGKLPLSSRQLSKTWAEYKIKYPFLRNKRSETRDILHMNEVEMKNFLESISSKPRHITLLDTSAKSTSIFGSMTRILWANTKIVTPMLDTEDSSYELRSKLFSLCSSWYSNAIKTKKSMEILLNSKLLQKVQVPERARKLKAFRDWIKTENKTKVMRYIRNECLGNLGFFTVRQDGWGKNRKGYGEWRGVCLGIPVKIEMMHTKCTLITVKAIRDIRNLGYHLKELMDCFCLEPPDEFHDYTHWLSPSGRIQGGAGSSKYTPIYVDVKLNVDVVDNVLDYEWTWSLEGNRLRLIAEYSQDQKMVILSESVTSYDWDPTYLIDYDPLLEPWSSGQPISLTTVESELSSVTSFTPADILKCIKSKYNKYTSSGWNVGQFISALSYMFSTEVSEIEDVILKEEVIESTQQEIDDLLMMINIDQTDLEMPDIEDDIVDEGDLFDLSAEISDDVLAQIDLFSSGQTDVHQIFHNKVRMPRSNQALSNLDILARAQFPVDGMAELIKTFKADSSKEAFGLMGVLLSFITSRICIPMAVDKITMEAAELDLDAISITTSIRTEAHLDNVDAEDLIQSINYLKDQIKTAPNIIRAQMVHTLARYENILALKTTKPLSLDALETTTSFELIEKIRGTLLTNKKIPQSYGRLDASLYYAVVKNELDEKIDQLTKDAFMTWREQSVYREAIAKPYVTSLLLDALCYQYDLCISMSGYKTTGSIAVNL